MALQCFNSRSTLAHVPAEKSLEVHSSRVQKLIPANGHVSIASLTDKQYGSIINYFGGNYAALSPMPKQLQMF